MKKSSIFAIVALLSMVAMSYAVVAVQVQPGPIVIAPNCCEYGEDCYSTQECCEPAAGTADCSEDEPNYCRKKC